MKRIVDFKESMIDLAGTVRLNPGNYFERSFWVRQNRIKETFNPRLLNAVMFEAVIHKEAQSPMVSVGTPGFKKLLRNHTHTLRNVLKKSSDSPSLERFRSLPGPIVLRSGAWIYGDNLGGATIEED